MCTQATYVADTAHYPATWKGPIPESFAQDDVLLYGSQAGCPYTTHMSTQGPDFCLIETCSTSAFPVCTCMFYSYLLKLFLTAAFGAPLIEQSEVG